jgi:hypothetical protein
MNCTDIPVRGTGFGPLCRACRVDARNRGPREEPRRVTASCIQKNA